MTAGSSSQVPRSLARGTIYLVRENVRDLSVPLDRLLLVLSKEELKRAARFRFEDDRLRTLVGWGLLRIVLGRILGKDPRGIEFTENEFHKPLLRNGPSFNMAHSGETVLLGVAADGRLGVDVEALLPIRDLDGLAATVFSERELSAFLSLPGPDRLLAFYRGWTRKEALLKAMGGGLSIPLKQFTVSLEPKISDALLWVDLTAEKETPWYIRPLPEEPDALSAIAWDRPVEEVQWVNSGALAV